MEVTDLALPGLKLIKPRVYKDERGFLLESYEEERYRAAGIEPDFVQDNHSRSVKGTLRGFHLQLLPGQNKLVRAASGRIFDVAVDVRPESPTFKRWLGVWLDDVEHHQLYIPRGFAHGFYVDSEVADVAYKVSTRYDPVLETGFAFDDPELGVVWPTEKAPLVSERDRTAQSFASYLAAEAARR